MESSGFPELRRQSWESWRAKWLDSMHQSIGKKKAAQREDPRDLHWPLSSIQLSLDQCIYVRKLS